MKPSVGRIVHYVNLGDKDGKYPPQVQAAVITGIYREVKKPYDGGEREFTDLELVNDGVGTLTDVISDKVDLKVFYRTGMFDCQKIAQRSEPTNRGVWDWPPRAQPDTDSISGVPV